MCKFLVHMVCSKSFSSRGELKHVSKNEHLIFFSYNISYKCIPKLHTARKDEVMLWFYNENYGRSTDISQQRYGQSYPQILSQSRLQIRRKLHLPQGILILSIILLNEFHSSKDCLSALNLCKTCSRDSQSTRLGTEIPRLLVGVLSRN